MIGELLVEGWELAGDQNAEKNEGKRSYLAKYPYKYISVAKLNNK